MEFEDNINYDTYSLDGDIFGLQYFNESQLPQNQTDQFTFSEQTTNNFTQNQGTNTQNQFNLESFLRKIWSSIPWDSILLVFWIVSGFLILILLGIYIYYQIKLNKIRKEVSLRLDEEINTQLASQASEPIGINQRWSTVQKLIASNNESDWRLAIIEADTVLESLLMQLGYEGNSLGERLSGAQKRHFPKLDQAWTAHIVRNRIAHEASSYALSKSDAVRTISLYEEVLKDANFIA